MSRTLLLIRHPPVAAAFRGLCYGASDVPLGPDGRATIPGLVAAALAAGSVTGVWHSGLSRSAEVAEAVAAAAGVPAVADARLRERHFGAWELRPWDVIHAETGDAMMGMVTDPAGWRPPDGETTFELRDRVIQWHATLPAAGVQVVVTHGGPIAALRGSLAGVAVAGWPGLIPAPGAVTALTEAPTRPCHRHRPTG